MSESSLTIISPTTLAEAKELATTLSAANSMPAALKKSPADVLAIVMAGAELGLAPMQSIRGIVLIQGRPTLSADTMGALVKASPKCMYLQCMETTAQRATFKTQRKGDPEPTVLSFTIEEATQAGLTGDNWKKFPRAMLRARAQSAICRLVYSDLMLGVYDPDELDAPAEKHVDSTATETPATVEALKSTLKKRRAHIVDVVPDAKPSPPALVESEDGRVGWGKNSAMKLADLEREKVEWYLADAEKKAEANANDDRDVWVDRMLRYSEELAKRVMVGGEAVAP